MRLETFHLTCIIIFQIITMKLDSAKSEDNVIANGTTFVGCVFFES